MALSERELKFIHEMLLDPTDQTQCAIRAGYSARSAKWQAHKMLKRSEIAESLTQARAARSERTKIDGDWVLARLAGEADADIADLYNDDGSLKPIREWPIAFRKGLVAGIEIEELFEGRGESRTHVGRVRKIKLLDRTKIVELIGKHIKVQAFGNTGSPDDSGQTVIRIHGGPANA